MVYIRYILCSRLFGMFKSWNFWQENKLQYVAKACKGSCPFARSDAIEDLCDQILASKLSNTPQLIDYSKKICGCPYFASRKAVAYSQLVLLPYQVNLLGDFFFLKYIAVCKHNVSAQLFSTNCKCECITFS